MPISEYDAPMARAATTSDVFNAIAEPQRREILVLLREVGLVRDRRAGRQRLYGLDARGLRPVHEWTGGFERFWNESFDRLDAYVQGLKQARSAAGGGASGGGTAADAARWVKTPREQKE